MTTIRIGYIPYLNMVPFHRGFGPGPLEHGDIRFEFPVCSPRTLGLEAEHGRVDAGALSLVDSFRLSSTFEPLGDLGIGVQGPAQSVLLFSRKPINALSGMCAVTDESATSVRLLQMLLEVRYQATGVNFGRIASSLMFDGDADALLLIGNEALDAKTQGIPGFDHITDLGQEWLDWQEVPFVFARWMVRKTLPVNVKKTLNLYVENSLKSTLKEIEHSADPHADYWRGFAYQLRPEHHQSIARFEAWVGAHV